MGKLNLRSFNDILFSALKEGAKKTELLEMEIELAYTTKIGAMEDVIDDLNNGKPYRKHLEAVNNIDANCNELAKMLEESRQEENQQVGECEET